MSLLALGNKTINDLTADRAIGSMKPMVPMPPPATAHLRAEQIDPNAVSRDAATVLASLYSSGVSPASLKEVLNNAIESKRKVEEQNAKMRQEVSRQNIAASTDMANKYNLFYTETLNKNIAERNQLAKQTYLDASRMSYANAENIGRLLAGFSENEINSILSRIEALRYSLLASGWGYYNKYKANSLLANWLGYSNKSKDNNSDSKNKISYGPNTITS
jgi:CRISPR/Cas system CSM-associated protein Csm2 small subunit